MSNSRIFKSNRVLCPAHIALQLVLKCYLSQLVSCSETCYLSLFSVFLKVMWTSRFPSSLCVCVCMHTYVHVHVNKGSCLHAYVGPYLQVIMEVVRNIIVGAVTRCLFKLLATSISCDYSTLYLHVTNVHVSCLRSVQAENNSLVVGEICF